MDGLEATRRIRAALPSARQPRIVAMTADATAEDRERSLRAGMDDHLSKPVRSEDLAEVLRRAADAAATPAAEGTEGPASEAAADLAPVDRTVLDQLTERLGERGDAVRAQLVDTWRAETSSRLRGLEAAVAAGDTEEVGRSLHALKGGSGTLGARRLAAACARVEEQLRDRAAVDLPAVVITLRAELEAASAAFDDAAR
jgi:HPt (histidine-containing phosphotransfer) domain-containing protein